MEKRLEGVMTYICSYSLACNLCGAAYNRYFDDKEHLIASAQYNGWLCRTTHGHLCENCAIPVLKKKEDKQKLKNQSKVALGEKSKERQERMNIAILMRSRGESYKRIGEKLGISGSRASQIVAVGQNIMSKKARIKTTLKNIGDPKAIKLLLVAGHEPLLPPLKR